MGSGDVQGLIPSLGMGVTPDPDGNVTPCGWGMLQSLVSLPRTGVTHP